MEIINSSYKEESHLLNCINKDLLVELHSGAHAPHVMGPGRFAPSGHLISKYFPKGKSGLLENINQPPFER